MRLTLFILMASLSGPAAHAYPIDGYPDTGIRRVEGARMAQEGLIGGSKQPPGALLTTDQVDLRLVDHKALELPEPDPAFTAQLLKLLGGDAGSYGVAVLDLSNPDKPRYAEHRGDHRQNVSSVGKLVVALGLFQALADTWPDDTGPRICVLRDTMVTADAFS